MTESDYITELRKRWPREHTDIEPSVDTIELTLKAITDYPNSEKLWIMRGNLLLLIDWDDKLPLNESEKCYRRAIKLNPNSFEAYYELGCYFDAVENNVEKANEYYKKSRQLENA